MNSAPFIFDLRKSLFEMTSYYNGVPHSSGVSDISSAPPSPVSGSTTGQSVGPNRFGIVVPNRVFVGGIAANTTESELQELFAQFGNIKEIKIISDRGGVCKGYGFVTFETEDEANKVRQQPDSLVLKERRLNIAPAVMKQQPFGRPPYEGAPPSGLVYHNGTAYTYQNGMAFFTAQSAQSPYSSRDVTMYAAPYGQSQSSPAPPYSQIMYTPYTQPMPYMATAGQQYPYQMPFDYFKPMGPSQYVYTSNALNGVLNGGIGNSSQSPSPGYGQASSAEMYYNTLNHQTPLQHQTTMYPMESSPAHSEDWNPEPRQTHTPVVSLLKLHEEGSVEELEITRTPKKSYPPSPGPGGPGGPGGPRPRSRRPGQGQGQQGPSPPQSRRLAGQRCASSPHLPSAPNSCLHRSTSLSPSNQVAPAYNSNRQPQHQNHLPHQHPGFHPRRGGGGGGTMRNLGPRSHSGNPRSFTSSGPNSVSRSSNTPKILGEVMNGVKSSPPGAPAISNISSALMEFEKEKAGDQGGAGDAGTGNHSLPLSPPDTPLSGGADGEVCKQMKDLAV